MQIEVGRMWDPAKEPNWGKIEVLLGSQLARQTTGLLEAPPESVSIWLSRIRVMRPAG